MTLAMPDGIGIAPEFHLKPPAEIGRVLESDTMCDFLDVIGLRTKKE